MWSDKKEKKREFWKEKKWIINATHFPAASIKMQERKKVKKKRERDLFYIYIFYIFCMCIYIEYILWYTYVEKNTRINKTWTPLAGVFGWGLFFLL